MQAVNNGLPTSGSNSGFRITFPIVRKGTLSETLFFFGTLIVCCAILVIAYSLESTTVMETREDDNGNNCKSIPISAVTTNVDISNVDFGTQNCETYIRNLFENADQSSAQWSITGNVFEGRFGYSIGMQSIVAKMTFAVKSNITFATTDVFLDCSLAPEYPSSFEPICNSSSDPLCLGTCNGTYSNTPPGFNNSGRPPFPTNITTFKLSGMIPAEELDDINDKLFLNFLRIFGTVCFFVDTQIGHSCEKELRRSPLDVIIITITLMASISSGIMFAFQKWRESHHIATVDDQNKLIISKRKHKVNGFGGGDDAKQTPTDSQSKVSGKQKKTSIQLEQNINTHALQLRNLRQSRGTEYQFEF